MYGFPLTLDDCYDDDYELRLILALKQQVNETMNYHELKRAIDNDDGNVTTKEADGAVCTNKSWQCDLQGLLQGTPVPHVTTLDSGDREDWV